MASPAPLTHPAFGTLAYDESLGWYETTLAGGARLDVSTDDPADGAIRDILDLLAERLDALVAGAKRFASDGLLGVKNDAWLDEGEGELSDAEFQARLGLDAVSVERDGLTFWFDDGDLFWGHTVVVYADAQGAFESAEIAG